MDDGELRQCTFGCVICTDSFNVNIHKKIGAIPCGHVYHESCLKRWFRTQIQQQIPSSCPKCRAPSRSSEILRLFLHRTDPNANDSMNISTDEESNGTISDVESNDSFQDFSFSFDEDFASWPSIPEYFDFEHHNDSLNELERHLDQMREELVEMDEMVLTMESNLNSNLH